VTPFSPKVFLKHEAWAMKKRRKKKKTPCSKHECRHDKKNKDSQCPK
jgi:hypothetical protein